MAVCDGACAEAVRRERGREGGKAEPGMEAPLPVVLKVATSCGGSALLSKGMTKFG